MFSEDGEDPTMRAQVEGGYVVTRPRHTRRPRRIFVTGFTNLKDEEKREFMDFWNAHTGSKAFEYEHPVDNEIVIVRFLKRPKISYVGRGGASRWDVPGIELEEV